jgi:hypothetical protein
MTTNKYDGQTLPFTSKGWTRQIKSGTYRNGASYKQVEKVRVVGRGTMGSKLEEVHVLASWDIDIGGNKTKNLRKGQHFLSLKKGVEELAFAIHDEHNGNGWRVLAYDCSYCLVVKTQQKAQEILAATRIFCRGNKYHEIVEVKK